MFVQEWFCFCCLLCDFVVQFIRLSVSKLVKVDESAIIIAKNVIKIRPQIANFTNNILISPMHGALYRPFWVFVK